MAAFEPPEWRVSRWQALTTPAPLEHTCWTAGISTGATPARRSATRDPGG